ncbi:imidazole glycerol phosphate synthase subunit HisH [Vibrio genomosp. F10]|uniref:imidazole glycerol phosphate synthase subunit HisH n=1 Tax=Vibrio genomosp. F10 TaxID=723171 RepID=UPI000474F039|nr:imidazole glycerol phosphate synthase subunit HisH [Vibrio genomosp. F10]OEF01108.1 imidazole glycerol phosphate synthase, glutamine amidotransferase subunit [Vibrio genomosp. F10 str. 9ZD137]
MISIINYGMGNIGSVANIIKKVGGECEIITTPEEVVAASKLLLPGVGSFDAGMAALRASGLEEAIKYSVSKHTPLLGICLGMQLLLDKSEEGVSTGLGLVSGSAKKFDTAKHGIKVPHMGWNTVSVVKESALFAESDTGDRFYFVHSYLVECDDESDIATFSIHGERFVSSFEKQNILGCQFHPEKSHKFGMKLMKRFLEL